MLKFITNHIRRGPKTRLKYIQIRNEANKIIETVHNKTEIENRLIQQNLYYYRKVFSLIYNDKIYHKLQENKMWNKILSGKLEQKDCDNEAVFKFLRLLKKTTEIDTMTFELMSTIE